MLRERQDALGKVSSAGADFFATAGAIVNTDDFLIATERKKQSAKIIVLEKQNNDHEHYVALADKAKELIEQLHDRGVITNEQLKNLIENHTWKKPGSKEKNKLGLVTLWLEVQEN